MRRLNDHFLLIVCTVSYLYVVIVIPKLFFNGAAGGGCRWPKRILLLFSLSWPSECQGTTPAYLSAWGSVSAVIPMPSSCSKSPHFSSLQLGRPMTTSSSLTQHHCAFQAPMKIIGNPITSSTASLLTLSAPNLIYYAFPSLGQHIS